MWTNNWLLSFVQNEYKHDPDLLIDEANLNKA